MSCSPFPSNFITSQTSLIITQSLPNQLAIERIQYGLSFLWRQKRNKLFDLILIQYFVLKVSFTENFLSSSKRPFVLRFHFRSGVGYWKTRPFFLISKYRLISKYWSGVAARAIASFESSSLRFRKRCKVNAQKRHVYSLGTGSTSGFWCRKERVFEKTAAGQPRSVYIGEFLRFLSLSLLCQFPLQSPKIARSCCISIVQSYIKPETIEALSFTLVAIISLNSFMHFSFFFFFYTPLVCDTHNEIYTECAHSIYHNLSSYHFHSFQICSFVFLLLWHFNL